MLRGLCHRSDLLAGSTGVQKHQWERERAPTQAPLPHSWVSGLKYSWKRITCFYSFSSRVVQLKSCLFSTLVVPITLPSASFLQTCTSRPCSMSPGKARSPSKTSIATNGSQWRTVTQQTSAHTFRKPSTSLVGPNEHISRLSCILKSFIFKDTLVGKTHNFVYVHRCPAKVYAPSFPSISPGRECSVRKEGRGTFRVMSLSSPRLGGSGKEMPPLDCHQADEASSWLDSFSKQA